MVTRIVLIISIVFACLCGEELKAQTNTYAPGHVYIYSNGKTPMYGRLYGLCTKDRKPVTVAKYPGIQQENLFLKCQLYDFNWRPNVWTGDLYNAWGKFLKTVSYSLPLNDSTMLVYIHKNGDSMGDVHIEEYTKAFQTYTTINKDGRRNEEQIRPDVALVYASGKIIDFDFQAVSNPLQNVITILKNGKQGVYNYVENKMILPPIYDSVMYKPDSFFLGWNSEKDYKLVDMQGKEYKAPALVYEADKINNSATIFGIQVNDHPFFRSYYNDGKLIDSFCKINPKLDCVLGYKNVKTNSIIYSPEVSPQNERPKTYLVDFNGKPLLDPKDNPDSNVSYTFNYICYIKKDTQAYGRTQAYVSAIYSIDKKKILIRADDSTRLYEGYEATYIRGNTRYYYDLYGTVIAKMTDCYEIEKIDSLNNNRVIEGGFYLLGLNKGYEVTDGQGVKYHFDEIKKAEPGFKKNGMDYYGYQLGAKNQYIAKINGKWGVYESKYLYKENKHILSNITTIIPPQYDDIFASYKQVGYQDNQFYLYQAKVNDKWLWIDSTGKILAGGKNFQYINKTALSNGHRLAYECRNIRYANQYFLIATKVMMIDSMGNVLGAANIDTSELADFDDFDFNRAVQAGDFHIVDEESVIGGNTLYNLKTGEKTKLFDDSYTEIKIYDVNGVVFSVSAIKFGKSRRNNPFDFFNIPSHSSGAGYRRERKIAILFKHGNSIRIEDDDKSTCYPGTGYFFHDATGGAGCIITQDGERYE